MEARFSGCAVATYWLPHTPVQIFFRLVLVHKKDWCSLSSLSIQTGVLEMTFRITLMATLYFDNNLQYMIRFCIFNKINDFWDREDNWGFHAIWKLCMRNVTHERIPSHEK